MPKRKRSQTDPIVAAREVARAEVARRWPELAGVEPSVTQRPRPDEAKLERLGAAAGSALPPAPRDERREQAQRAEYTFTFAGHIHTPDGYTMPRVARVTVDAHKRVVKATTSK